MNPAALVNTDRWPLESDAVIAPLKQQFQAEHIAILPGFIREEALTQLVQECDELATTISLRRSVRRTQLIGHA